MCRDKAWGRSVVSIYMAKSKLKKAAGKAKRSKAVKPLAATAARIPAIRTVMMPRDTNPLGSIFGGHILSLIDQAAGQHARTIAPKRYVTKVMHEVNFIAPVYVGDLVSFYAETVKIGNTSIVIHVDVEALRGNDCVQQIHVTSAEVVMVAVDDKNRPIAIFG